MSPTCIEARRQEDRDAAASPRGGASGELDPTPFLDEFGRGHVGTCRPMESCALPPRRERV
jgi:hypothetical protein